MLQLFVATDPQNLPCSRQKFYLRVTNPRSCSVDAGWSESFQSNLDDLMRRFTAKHPALRLRVNVKGWGDSFEYIDAFMVFSANMKRRGGFGINDGEPELVAGLIVESGQTRRQTWED